MKTNRRIIADHYAASDRRDLDGMFADVAEDVQWTEMAGFPCAGTFVGREAVAANVFAVLGREWDGFGFRLERLVDGGETVVGIGEYSGTHRATGKSMRARVVHVWQLEGGKVTRFEQFCDTRLVAQAME
jgi:ketosteroid isomerase-like protein